MPIDARLLIPVAPVSNGVARLKKAIYVDRNLVGCICGAASELHIGAKDAEDMFERGVRRGFLEPRGDGDGPVRWYVPTEPATQLNVEEGEVKAKRLVERGYSIIEAAYPEYRRSLSHLSEQPGEMHRTFIRAFSKLTSEGFLPLTTQNAQFNHLGMALLMDRCFPSRSALIDYLRNPVLHDTLGA